MEDKVTKIMRLIATTMILIMIVVVIGAMIYGLYVKAGLLGAFGGVAIAASIVWVSSYLADKMEG